MKVVTPNKDRLFLSAFIIFTINGLLTLLFLVLNLPFSFIIVPLITCVTGLVIFSAYGAYVIWKSLNWSRGQKLDETSPLLERRENLELGLSTSSDISTESPESFSRKKSSPIPTPKTKVTHHNHPTPMPRESYLTDIFMEKFKALGDLIRSRRHTVSESDADNIIEHLKSSRIHTMSESEMVNQSARFSPNSIRRKHPSGESEDLFTMDPINGDQHNKGYKNS